MFIILSSVNQTTMKKLFLYLCMGAAFAVTAQNPPVAPVKVVTEEFFGQKIDDPYRYMENLDDPAVESWLKAQGDYATGVLSSINGREALVEQFREFDQRRSSRVFGLKITDNDLYFYRKMTPEDETGKLYFRKGFAGEEELLFDPETYRPEDGKQYVINSVSPNHDGSKVAFSIAANGSESSTILILDMATKKMHDEKLEPCWSDAGFWLKDGKSFYYSKLNSGDIKDMNRQLNNKVYLHQVGTPASADQVVFSAEMYPELGITPEEIPYLVYDRDTDKVFCYPQTVNFNIKVFVTDAPQGDHQNLDWKPLVSREDEIKDLYTDKEYIYYKSTLGSPNFKILYASIENPDPDGAKVLIEESKDEVLEDFVITSQGYYYSTIQNGVSARVYHKASTDAAASELSLPFAAGSATITAKDIRYPDFWVTLNGWTRDYERFRYVLSDSSFHEETLSDKAEFPEFDNLVAEEVMVPSHDGVMVPLSIIYKKDLVRNGDTPLMIYGYGSYGISMNPFFSSMFLSWVSEGGVMAIAHVRGGGELGDQWHKAGFKQTKPNTWKDLIACAEYLHVKKFSSPGKTAIFGGSAGGILIGRAMTDRPDLFAVAIPAVGTMNALRAEFTPNGPVNVPEFGTVEKEDEFKALFEMDSYHHLKDGVKYPATLSTAGVNDPRVIVWEPAKFVARLQAANASENPILFRVDYESGHGSDAKTKAFNEFADIMSFAFWQTGHPRYQAIKQPKKALAE